MFKYSELLEACKRSEVDPFLKGCNLEAKTILAGCKYFDLSQISFPKEELGQVLSIGLMVENLISQVQPNTFSVVGKNEKIKKMLKTAMESQEFWFKKGLELSATDKILILHNGNVLEKDPKHDELMEEFNSGLQKIVEDASSKEKASWASSRNVPLG